jgi:transposase
MWAEGTGVTAIVRALGKTKRTAFRWRSRYVEQGIEGLRRDATRPGRKKPLEAAMITRVVEMTLHEKPLARISHRAAADPGYLTGRLLMLDFLTYQAACRGFGAASLAF